MEPPFRLTPVIGEVLQAASSAWSKQLQKLKQLLMMPLGFVHLSFNHARSRTLSAFRLWELPAWARSMLSKQTSLLSDSVLLSALARSQVQRHEENKQKLLKHFRVFRKVWFSFNSSKAQRRMKQKKYFLAKFLMQRLLVDNACKFYNSFAFLSQDSQGSMSGKCTYRTHGKMP